MLCALVVSHVDRWQRAVFAISTVQYIYRM